MRAGDSDRIDPIARGYRESPAHPDRRVVRVPRQHLPVTDRGSRVPRSTSSCGPGRTYPHRTPGPAIGTSVTPPILARSPRHDGAATTSRTCADARSKRRRFLAVRLDTRDGSRQSAHLEAMRPREFDGRLGLFLDFVPELGLAKCPTRTAAMRRVSSACSISPSTGAAH